MTVKQFFKSTSFKCLITLLCVLLVSGIFLTVMNGLLKVTDQEKFDRAISKIYGKSVETEKVEVTEQYNDGATVNEAYKVKDDGNYLIKSTGKGGFDNGTVTCWVVVTVNGDKVSGVDKVVIDSNTNQSYISKITDKFLNGFKTGFVEGTPYTPAAGTGATMSAGAICRAVNGAVDFVNAQFGNVTTEGEKVLTLIKNLYGDTAFTLYGANDKVIEATDETVESYISEEATSGNATINAVYKTKYQSEGSDVWNYVVLSTGSGGYDDGTVTMLTAFIVENNALKSIYKTVITDNVSQSFIGIVSHLDKYAGVEITSGLQFATEGDYVSSGATMSSTAINNAVNGAIKYAETNVSSLFPQGGN